ncbi:MAG: T9SS type A sorting domain-containing protein, partial [Bacteroidota bacterium]
VGAPLGTSTVYVVWEINAPVQELKLKGKSKNKNILLPNCNSDEKIVYKKVTAPTGITVNSSNCTSASLTAQIGTNSCRAPDQYRWYKNGSLFATTSGTSQTVTISTSQSTTVEVSAMYAGSESSRASVSIPASIDWPSGINGLSILVDNSSENYGVYGTNGTVTQWMVSSTNVSIASNGTNSALLTVSNFVDGHTFIISAKVEKCGEYRWYTKNVEMDEDCPSCPIPIQGMLSDGTAKVGVSDLDGSNLKKGEKASKDMNRLGLEWSSIEIYPNPISKGQELILKQLPEQHEIKVFNMQGQQLQRLVSSGFQSRLSTEGFEVGMYMIVVKDLDTQKEVTTKVVIK